MAERSFTTRLGLIWELFEESFQFACNGELLRCMQRLSRIGNQFFYFVGLAFALDEVMDIFYDEKRSGWGKIFPLMLAVSTASFSLVAGILFFTAAATFVLPPLLFASSVVDVARKINLYFEERWEREELKKALSGVESEIDELAKKLNLSNSSSKSANLGKNKILSQSLSLSESLKAFFKEDEPTADKIQDLYIRLGNNFINNHLDEQNELTTLLAKDMQHKSPEEVAEHKKAIAQKEEKMTQKFLEEYKPLFALFEKKQRLHFLDVSVTERVKHIAAGVSISLLSLLVMILPFAIAGTPAAPAAPFMYAGISVVSGGFSLFVAVNSIKLFMHQTQSEQATEQPKQAVSQAVFPNLQAEAAFRPQLAEKAVVLYPEEGKGRWETFKEMMAAVWRGENKKENSTTLSKKDNPLETESPVSLPRPRVIHAYPSSMQMPFAQPAVKDKVKQKKEKEAPQLSKEAPATEPKGKKNGGPPALG